MSNPPEHNQPVLSQRVRRMLGWHAYDWAKLAVACVLAAALFAGRGGEETGETNAAQPTSSPPTVVAAAAIQGATAAPVPTTPPTDALVAPEATVLPTSAPAATAPPTAAISATTAPVSATTDIIVVTDVSGSMAADNKIAAVRTALARFADQIKPGSRVELITFSDDAAVRLPMADVDASRTKAKQIARDLTPGGATTLYDTTLLAFGEMQRHGNAGHRRVIIVLTDGRDERLDANDQSIPGSTATLDQTLSGIAQGARSGTTLFTIGYGAAADNAVLQRMAAAANGQHFTATPATLQDVYQTIAQLL